MYFVKQCKLSASRIVSLVCQCVKYFGHHNKGFGVLGFFVFGTSLRTAGVSPRSSPQRQRARSRLFWNRVIIFCDFASGDRGKVSHLRQIEVADVDLRTLFFTLKTVNLLSGVEKWLRGQLLTPVEGKMMLILSVCPKIMFVAQSIQII